MNHASKRARPPLWTLLTALLAFSPLFASAAAYPHAIVQAPVSTCVNGAPRVTLTWGAPSGATSYSLFRNKSSSTWLNVSSKQSSSSFTDSKVSSGVSYQYQIKTYFSWQATYSNIVTVVVPMCSGAATPPPAAPPPPPVTTGEIKFNAYITGYGWPDNTPPSAEISDGAIHSSAGGTGTYADPITIAVGHSIVSGKDILDYPKGTKFYIPSFRRYFIVEDTCGDGNTPQNGPCHTGYQGHPWLDAWVGGTSALVSATLACEDKITDIHTVIQNPGSGYLVVPGAVFNTVCTALFGDLPLTI